MRSWPSPSAERLPRPLEDLRRRNLEAVVDLLMAGPCTRSELAVRAGVSRTTAWALVEQLRRIGVLAVDRAMAPSRLPSAGGRPAELIALDPRKALLVAMDVGEDGAAELLIAAPDGHPRHRARVVASADALAAQLAARIGPEAIAACVLTTPDSVVGHAWADAVRARLPGAVRCADAVLMAAAGLAQGGGVVCHVAVGDTLRVAAVQVDGDGRATRLRGRAGGGLSWPLAGSRGDASAMARAVAAGVGATIWCLDPEAIVFETAPRWRVPALLDAVAAELAMLGLEPVPRLAFAERSSILTGGVALARATLAERITLAAAQPA